MVKKCQICGKEFETIKNGNSRKYCFDCVPETNDIAKRTIFKRQSLKREGVKRLGGKCQKCGETRPYMLAFHHIDSSKKEFNFNRLLANSKIDEFFKEIQKCTLLCCNCHTEFHYLKDNYNITLEEYLKK